MGAIYHTTAVIEPLTDFIFCADRPVDQGARVFVLDRLFTALSNAYNTLKDYYGTLESRIRAQTISINTSLFPYRVAFSSNDEVFTMTYLRWLDQDKLIWTAETSRRESVIVKFARRYCSDAHQLLADAGLAPKLYYADKEDSTEILRMIVMQNIEATIPLSNVPTLHRPRVFDEI
jgi:hypothetical protein